MRLLYFRRSADKLKLTVSGLVFLLIGFLIGMFFGPVSQDPAPSDTKTKLTVRKVIDGDTILLSDNTLVRLLGVDAPEYGKPGFTEAKEYVNNITQAQEVRLELDQCCELDIHGRTLGYVWISAGGGEELLNKLLLDQDLAVSYLPDQLERDYLQGGD